MNLKKKKGGRKKQNGNFGRNRIESQFKIPELQTV